MSVHVNKKPVCKIITDDLGKKELCMQFVPHGLTDILSEFLEMSNNDPKFLNKIATCDKSWCFP